MRLISRSISSVRSRAFCSALRDRQELLLFLGGFRLTCLTPLFKLRTYRMRPAHAPVPKCTALLKDEVDGAGARLLLLLEQTK